MNVLAWSASIVRYSILQRTASRSMQEVFVPLTVKSTDTQASVQGTCMGACAHNRVAEANNTWKTLLLGEGYLPVTAHNT
jgi:hypothetical protein